MNTDLLASVALGVLALYGLVAVLGRSLLQRRTTGSSGWRGGHAAIGSAQWYAGLSMFGAIVGLVLAPTITALGPSTALAPWRVLGGAALLLGGIVLTFAAQVNMGSSWRIGVQPGEHTELRTTGLFAWCRNPIFTGMLLTTAGAALWVPLAAPAWVLLCVGIQLQVRRVEEPHLLRTHGECYRAYAARTGRYWPGLGRGIPNATSS